MFRDRLKDGRTLGLVMVIVAMLVLAAPMIMTASYAAKPDKQDNNNGNNNSNSNSNNNQNSNNVNINSNPVQDVKTNTKVRAFQSGDQITEESPGMIGVDTDCIGGIESSAAVKMICYLIPPGVSNNDNTNAISQLDTTSTIPCPSGVGFSGDHTCFSVTFPGSLFTQGGQGEVGEYHFHAEFYDAQNNLIADGKQTFQNHSFFVIPESGLGAIALVGSSLGGLGGFYFLRGRLF